MQMNIAPNWQISRRIVFGTYGTILPITFHVFMNFKEV